MTVRVMLGLLLLWAETAGASPAFPWSSFRAMAAEQPVSDIGLCNPENVRTHISALLIPRPQDFYRMWAMLDGQGWLAIHYDADGRPDWVWRGTWSGDLLTVTFVTPYDPYAHASACDLLFGSDL